MMGGRRGDGGDGGGGGMRWMGRGGVGLGGGGRADEPMSQMKARSEATKVIIPQ